MKHKINAFGQIMFVFISCAAIAPIWYWQFFEPTPIENVEIKLIDKFTWAGGKFRVQLTADIENECPGKTTYTIIDSHGASFQISLDENTPVGVYAIEVPKEVSAGMATYYQTTIYNCNPLRAHVFKSPAMEVYVVS